MDSKNGVYLVRFSTNSIHLSMKGSVLLYVLWILVVITVLAFQLTAESRVVLINNSSSKNQLLYQMQIKSAIQFARFKLIENKWENNAYDIKLNKQNIAIKIYNESGFISIYDFDNKAIKNVFSSIDISEDVLEEIGKFVGSTENRRFNTFSELLQFDGINMDVLTLLIPLISIYNNGGVNPRLSPNRVLILLPGVDQYSVNKLSEIDNKDEQEQLRQGVFRSLLNNNRSFSKKRLNYYRVDISISSKKTTVFLKFDSKNEEVWVVDQS